MPEPGIPDDVRRFLLTSALSVPHVEAVLLMRREREAPWSSARLASRLYINEAVAARLLSDLSAQGIISSNTADQTFAYRPATGELAAVLDGLDHAYSKHLLEVTRMIHLARDDTAQQFADAFRFRKDA